MSYGVCLCVGLSVCGQIIFIDDSKHNITKSQSYCIAMLVQGTEGMTEEHMRSIEEQCNVVPPVEVTTPRTVEDQISKHYPRTSDQKESEADNPLAKYKIADVPQWFDKLTNPEMDTPVIQVGGDQTPGSDSEYELNVPMLNSELDDIVNKKPKSNALSLALSSDEEENDQKQSGHTHKQEESGPMLSLDADQIANED